MRRVIVNFTELVLTTFIIMLVWGAVAGSLGWLTLSFLQVFGLVYIFKCLVASAVMTVVNSFANLLRSAK